MRNLYLSLTAVILLVIILIAFAFFFFEKEKHQNFLYTIEIAGEKPAHVEIDRYKTEDKIVYKSTSFRPKGLHSKIIDEKSVFDRKNFKLGRFDKESKNFGVITEFIHIKNNNDETLDFLAKAGSKFSHLARMAHAKGISIFNEESMVSYMPFVDKYNFAMGGAQSFNALYGSTGLLPPAKAKIVFTSIRDEYINTLGKKTKTECFVVRAKGIPEVYIWVSKKDKSIVRLEIKSRSLLIKRVAARPISDASPRAITDTQSRAIKDKSYDSHNIIFPSGDIALAGTVSIPRKDGKLAAVLLIGEEGPYNRENAGLYADISRKLAQGGYIALSFDRRGIGESQGNNMTVSIADEIGDIENALWFLANHERVDKDKIFVAAHGSACSYLPRLDFSKFPVKGLIFLGLTKPAPLLDFECIDLLDKIKAMGEVDETYPETLELLKTQTLGLVKNTEKDYVFIDGRRIFLKRMRELSGLKPLEDFGKLNVPLIILYGKKDPFISLDYIKSVRKALKETKSMRPFQVIGLKGPGHFFGELVDEKNMPLRYKVNKEVLKTIKGWIDKRCIDELREKADGLTNA